MLNADSEKTLKKCFLCKSIFTEQSAAFTISFKGIAEHQTVCGSCHHSHYELSE